MKYLMYVLLFGLFQFLQPQNILSQTIITADSYKFLLEPEWQIVPESEINKEIKRLKDEFEIVIPPLDYLLQLKKEKAWFQRPFIIVRTNSDGQIPTSEVEKLIKLNETQISQLKESLLKSTNNLITLESIDKQFYDSKRHIIYSIFNSDVAAQTKTVQIQAWILTKDGYIQVLGSYLLDDFALRYSQFLKFVSEFVIK